MTKQCHYLSKVSVQAVLELSLINVINVVVAYIQKVSSHYILAPCKLCFSDTEVIDYSTEKLSVLAGHTAMSNNVPASLNDY